jgi:hypothetical protein
MVKKKHKGPYKLEKVKCESTSDYSSVETVLGDIHPIHEIHLEPYSWKRGPHSTRIRVYAGQSLYVVHGHVELDVPEPETLESGDLIRVFEDTDFEAVLHTRRALVAVFNWHDHHEDEVRKKWDSHRRVTAERAKRPRPKEPDPDLSGIEQCLDLFLLEFKPHQKVSERVDILYLPNHIPTPQLTKRWEGISITEIPPDLPDYTRVFITEQPDDSVILAVSHGCTPVEYWRWEFTVQYGKAEITGRHFLDSRI